MSDTIPLGSVVYAAVKPIFKIYFIIAIGFYLAKRNILTVTTCRDISDAIVSAIMPCLIFYNIVSNLRSSDVKSLGIIFFTSFILFIVGVLGGLVTHYAARGPKRWFGGILSVGLFPNISDLPIAYMQTLGNGGLIFSETQASKGVAYICIFLAAQILVQFSLGLYRLIEWDFRDDLKEKDDESTGRDVASRADLNNSNTEKGSTLSDAASNENSENTSLSESIASDESHQEAVANELQSSSYPQQLVDENASTKKVISRSHSRKSPRDDMSYSASIPTSLRSRTRRSSVSQTDQSNIHSLMVVNSRTTELRQQKSQDISDVINEYSEHEALRRNEVRRSVTGMSDVGVQPISEDDHPSRSKFKGRVLDMLKNFKTPNSISLIVAIAVAMSPPLKALFVKGTFYMPSAPDEQPPLSFIMDLTSYIGNASVPLGLLLCGATLSRLQVKSMPPGFWKTAVCVTVLRLVILPIIGVGVTTGISKAGWYGSDILLRFISVLSFGLPSATSLIYFTAFYTDANSDDHLQMDCLAICMISQYMVLFVSLPFLISFTLKVSIGM